MSEQIPTPYHPQRPVLLAVDPGASGGLAFQHEDGHIDCVPMPDTPGDILTHLRVQNPGTAYIEALVKHMGAGIPASTMAVYASNHGFIVGALMALRWRVQIVTPQAWQKALGLGITGRLKAQPGASVDERKAIARQNAELKRAWKAKLRSEAQRLFPQCQATLKTADSLLILEYGRRRPSH